MGDLFKRFQISFRIPLTFAVYLETLKKVLLPIQYGPFLLTETCLCSTEGSNTGNASNGLMIILFAPPCQQRSFHYSDLMAYFIQLVN
jgi:hypothetical protein